MLIVFRFFAGVAGSTPITIGGGTFGDLFSVEERGSAMAVWAMGPLLGPVIGPVAGGFIAETIGWRWTFWIISIIVSQERKNIENEANFERLVSCPSPCSSLVKRLTL